ncbi:nucleotide-binding universal stress UspA family protein [Actinoplanes campanulatus]|uniref:Nucleotide-binding universal stress UspA family protein n=1 Tax=Actinoplanes campanulatus TaxID=113559 RepID=A0A7W5FK52_9ACTN|nr:hypothetical protein [Actinoplanes campanulatus]MBB3101483.1 nucleotide-binding universal stress UspA family protein [Actinoplanes campanulatus]
MRVRGADSVAGVPRWCRAEGGRPLDRVSRAVLRRAGCPVFVVV